MTQLKMQFEVEKLLSGAQGRLKRGSQIRRRGQLPPTDPHVTQLDDVVRFTTQNDVILDRLEQGPAANHELAALAINYRARISDLRAHGFVIRCDRKSGGHNVYSLVTRPAKVSA